MGLPLFILAMFSGSLEKLPRSGEWMLWVRKLMGWVLVGMAAYFIKPLLPESVSVFLLAAVALAAAVHLGWLDRTTAAFRSFQWLKTSAALAGSDHRHLPGGVLGAAGPRSQPGSRIRTSSWPKRERAQAGDHRFLRHLVLPLPGIG